MLADADARDAERGRALSGEATARARLAGVGLAVDLSPSALRSAAGAARELAGRFDGLRGLEADRAAERAAAEAADREASAAAARGDVAAVLLAALPDRWARATAEVTAARDAAAELPRVQTRLSAAGAALAEARGLRTALDRLATLGEEHLLARKTAVSLREKEMDLREARLTSMVAELAATLQPGAPCEVCGSVDHPDPYEGTGDGVSREDEERARLEAGQAERVVTELGQEIAAVTATADGHRARLVAAGHPDGDVALLLRAEQALVTEVTELAGRAADWLLRSRSSRASSGSGPRPRPRPRRPPPRRWAPAVVATTRGGARTGSTSGCGTPWVTPPTWTRRSPVR